MHTKIYELQNCINNMFAHKFLHYVQMRPFLFIKLNVTINPPSPQEFLKFFCFIWIRPSWSKHVVMNFMFFAPWTVIPLHNTNQRNAQFYKLIFNFWCLLHISNLVGSSSGRQLYMQYGKFYKHRCELSGGKESVFDTRLLTPMHVKYQKLNINLQNCAFSLIVLYKCCNE